MLMSQIATTPYEAQYMEILKNLMKNGVVEKNERTGIDTIRGGDAIISVDLEEEFPVLKSKHVYWKTSAKEILWIMKDQSSNINTLDAHIWDEWADPFGSIGKSYGYQVSKPVTISGRTYENQVDYVLNELAEDPSSRRAQINLWNVDELGEMNLVPCCFNSGWTVINGKLNCMLHQRSADYLVGVPFNTTQYAILTYLFARHLGVKPGRITHVMTDTHIYCYDSHLEGAKKMLNNFELIDQLALMNYDFAKSFVEKSTDESIQKAFKCATTTPMIKLPEKLNFFDVSIDDIKLENYNYMEDIKFDVAV